VRDECFALHTRQQNVERGSCFLLRAEAADLALASLAAVIEAEVEPVAPRSIVGSRLANAPSHALIADDSVVMCRQSMGTEPISTTQLRAEIAAGLDLRGAGCEDRTRRLMITNPIGTVRPVAPVRPSPET